MQNGNPAIGIQIMKENDANVLETLTTVKTEIAAMRDNELKAMGLSIAQSFDPSVFIGQAIDMVTGNLFAGILLAVAVLWLFVRDRRATLLVGLSIPICLTVTLVMLFAFGSHAERHLARRPGLWRRTVARYGHRHARGHHPAA